MTVRQASSPITNADLRNAVTEGDNKNVQDKFSNESTHGAVIKSDQFEH